MQPIKLFCLPNAGGTAIMYAQWKKLLDPSIQCCPIELAGRGRRFEAQLYSSIAEAVEDIVGSIEPQLGTSKFAFFGHSMGALLCYEVILTLWQKYHIAPVHAFFSARTPPNHQVRKALHVLPDHALAEHIFRWGGLSRQLYTNREFMNMFLPILRADLKLVETYNFESTGYQCIPCPLSILVGKDDAIATMEQMPPWENFTMQSCDFHEFEGGHFYLLEQSLQVIQLINTTISYIIEKQHL